MGFNSPTPMDIKEIIEYICKVDEWRSMKLGLERITELLNALGNPHKELKFVHVAGTNGKGSTSACIASVLQKAGYKTGLFISPYVIKFNERIQINGEYISDDDLIETTNLIRSHAEAMKDSPTVFEKITAIGMQYFKQQKCDIVVLEVGMGGELDSTNVIDTPEVAVITLIGYDHVKELGPTITDIARAKAGIIKGGDVVVYDNIPEVKAVFESVSNAKNANLAVTDFSRISNVRFQLSETKFDFKPYGEMHLHLVGTYQPKNAAVAITAIETLRNKGYEISDEDIIHGIKSAKWQGRFEVLGYNPVFILDGAHNPQGIEAVAESLKRYFENRKIVFVLGVNADKDVASMIKPIVEIADTVISVRSDNPRAMDENTLAENLRAAGVQATPFSTIDEGVNYAIELAGEDGVVCSIGSLYLSGDVRKAHNKTGDGSLS